MELVTLASGSSGNCLMVSEGETHVLVDCGVSCKRIVTALAELGLAPERLSGVVITHEHADHIAGLATLTKKYVLPVYTSCGTSLELRRRIAFPSGVLREVEAGRPFAMGSLEARSFHTSHDAAEPMGYTFSGRGKRAAVVTDLGFVSEEVLEGVLGSDLVVCEANHDVDWLRTGPYPYPLKRRILGDRGHLSNEAGADLALRCVEQGAKTVVLAHLSQQNNTPRRAFEVASETFRAAGVAGVTLAVAPRNETSEVFEV